MLRHALPTGSVGSTLLVVVAAIAILLATAATVVPGVVGVLELERVERAATALRVYERAIARFAARLDAKPGTLEQLTRQIVPGDLDSCGGSYNNQQLKDDGSAWLGPYLTRVVPSHGAIPVEIGELRNQLSRDPAVAQNRNDPGELILEIVGVDLTAARALDTRIDGSADGTAGTVRWGDTDAEGFVTVGYHIPVTGC